MENQYNEMEEDGVRGKEITINIDKKPKGGKTVFILTLLIILAVAAVIMMGTWVLDDQKERARVLTTSTLKEIIDISEISTLQAVYNGIAEVKNEKDPEKTDYYVSYKAQVTAGFDLKKVAIYLDDEVKRVTVTIPKINIIDTNVDITSLDYMFYNKKADKSAVSAQAYKACIADAVNENTKTLAIFDFAEENAKNAMEALVSPFIEQLHTDYVLEIIMEGTR
ncbi:MAG: DUF4230 domain-containing protein [Saccharofermentanales bacterium]